MLAEELGQYEKWKQGTFTLPEFNWVANRLPAAPKALKTFTQRPAMDLIWQQQGATPENASWLTSKMPAMVSLVKAVTKLLSAQAHLAKHDPLARLTESEAAEIETLQLVNATVEQNVARERARLRSLIDSIHESWAVLRNRLKSLGK